MGDQTAQRAGGDIHWSGSVCLRQQDQEGSLRLKLTYRVSFAAACAVLFSIFCLSDPAQGAHSTEPERQRDADAVGLQMRNVNFRLSPDIVLEVRTLRGDLQRTRRGEPVTFDDPDSFNVNIDSAQVAMNPDSLTALMNSYVFAYKGAPIKNVVVTMEGGRLIQKGTMHKGIDLPFTIEASVSATPDGDVRVHADKIKAEHLPVKGLLHFFGEDLEKLIHENPGRGVRAEGDDLILAAGTLTPPPHMQGRVVRAGIVGNSIILVFDSGHHAPALKPPLRAGAYIYHRGGVLRFGKLTMNDADLEIVGDRPGVFDFFQREYLKQLVAGYSKTTPANGLIAHMADYSRVRSTAAALGDKRQSSVAAKAGR